MRIFARLRRPIDERGAVAVEAALITPLFLLLMFGIIDFGLLIRDQVTVTAAVRAGGRVASALPQVAPTAPSTVAPFLAETAATMTTASNNLTRNGATQLWIYNADLNGGKPPTTCNSSAAKAQCVEYTWNTNCTDSSVTDTVNGYCFSTNEAGNWPYNTVNACPGTEDSVGVYLKTPHDFITPFWAKSDLHPQRLRGVHLRARALGPLARQPGLLLMGARPRAQRWLRLQPHGDEQGYIVVMTAILLPVLLAITSVALDTSRWYLSTTREQKAADAAALAGAVFLPDNPTKAIATAKTVAAQNGYCDPSEVNTVLNGTTLCPAANATVVATQDSVSLAKLHVTITSTTHNFFGSIPLLHSPTSTFSRTATADYAGPVPLGSPCNLFGNEPPPNQNGSVADDLVNSPPVNVTTANSGVTGCTSDPNIWGEIAGPNQQKQQGDQYQPRVCGGGEDGCNGTQNNDFAPAGYYYTLQVTKPVTSLTVQVFDPAFVDTGLQCTSNLPSSWSTNSPNPYVTDAKTRYAQGGTPYCTGDGATGSDSPLVPPTTSYAVLAPTTSDTPTGSVVCGRQGVPASGGTQFPGFSGNLQDALTSGQSLYNNPLPGVLTGSAATGYVAKVFRQWVTLCTITNPQVGDYFIQVQTDVPYGSTTPSTTDLGAAGNGENHFAMRAVVNGDATAVSIAGDERMAIFQNATSSTATFFLARIGSDSAGRNLIVDLFDVGDAEGGAGTITIDRPSDATGSALSNCTEVLSEATSTLPTCKLTNVQSSTYNGKLAVVEVPIPTNYTCADTNPGGCWFKVTFSFPGAVTDASTWGASLDGQPVRLVP